jgi:hypothetical protein
MGLLKCFTSIFGIIFGIAIMVLAVYGVVGSWLNKKRLMFFFLIGMGILFVVEIGYFVFTERDYATETGMVKSDALWGMILSAIMLAYYCACLWFGYRIWKA